MEVRIHGSCGQIILWVWTNYSNTPHPDLWPQEDHTGSALAEMNTVWELAFISFMKSVSEVEVPFHLKQKVSESNATPH